MAGSAAGVDRDIAEMDAEQLPVPDRELHGAGHFAGLYAAEHVAATEFVIGTTFVALGAGIKDILLGLIIGNALAVLSFWLITSPIAVQSRLSLYTYLNRIAGGSVSRIYNGANAVIFTVISAAMITVSATAVRKVVDLPAQVEAYPTHIGFVVIAVAFATLAVLVAVFGFAALARFAGICGPWLMVAFTVGGMVLLPALAESVTGFTTLTSFSDFVQVAGATVFTGTDATGEPGIGMLEVIGFAWAANTFAHFGLIDMALLRYAKKTVYGLTTATGMLFGHYVAWISAGLMGAAAALIMQTSITAIDPGDVAWYGLGAAGFVAVIVAGWTTATPNLYRAGLAAQAVFPRVSRTRVTLMLGICVAVASCFPFIYQNMLPLLTYAGLILVPVGGIVFAEHHIFPRVGLHRYWARHKGVRHNVPALVAWSGALLIAVAINISGVIPYFYLFLPAWLAAIIIYTVLARRLGAAEEYPEEVAVDRAFDERVRQFQERQAAAAPPAPVKERSVLMTAIRAVTVLALVVPVLSAGRVLFFSPDLFSYIVNREQFYLVMILSTVVYFVFAYWAVHRSMARARLAQREADEVGQAEDAVVRH